jgi:peroxiredoxin
MKTRAVVATALVLACVLPCGLSGCRASESEGDAIEGEAAPDAARMAPDFTLEDLDGKLVKLSALRGKTVVIDFWATWCPPCEFQVPVLNAIHETWHDRGVVVLGISVDTEGREAVKPYAEKHGVRYTMLLGSEALARDFGAPGFPALVVVGPDGAIRSMHVGLVEEPELQQVLAEAGAPGKAG